MVKFIGANKEIKTLAFTPSSGTLSGSFTNTLENNKVETFTGWYLELPWPNNIIGGYYLGTNQAGQLLVQP
jgi:hypothetical protein